MILSSQKTAAEEPPVLLALAEPANKTDGFIRVMGFDLDAVNCFIEFLRGENMK